MLFSPSETVLAWANRVEAQRVKTVMISSLCELRSFDGITHKENRLRDKNMQVTQTSPEEDASTVDNSI